MNDVTRNQLEDAEKKGALRVHAPMDRIISGTWSQAEIDAFADEFQSKANTPIAIIDTMCEIGETVKRAENPAQVIACSMGRLGGSLLERMSEKTFMIIGGDTLLGFIKELGIQALEPVRGFASGTVLSRYTYEGTEHYLITKSGGFGSTGQLTEIQKELQEGI